MRSRTKVYRALVVVAILGCIALAFSKPWSHPEVQPRKLLYYQDSMHPWVKSDRPGKCTVCAMDLTPIYAGTQGFEVSSGTVVLSSNSITVLNVQTEKVSKQPLRHSLRVAGTLEANETSRHVISAGKAGRIERLAVPYVGFEVAEGQRLANFFIPDLLAEARRYALLARTGARGGQTSEADLSNPLLSALQNLRLFGLTETQIDTIAKTGKADGFFELLSPLAGTVVERNVSEGQYVSEGARLFTIVDLSTLWFRFDVYEQDLPWLRLGQVVEISVPSAPGKVFSGPIKFIEPFVNDATRSAKVRVDVDNPLVEINGVKQRILHQQLYAEGRVRAETPPRLVIPASAVLFPGEQAYAYVDAGAGAYELRHLKLGRHGDREWEVLEGLEAGEAVVTAGNVLLDAQAQFSRGPGVEKPSRTELAGVASESEHLEQAGNTAKMPREGLTQARHRALRDFLSAADGVSRALADDSLDQLKAHTATLPVLADSLERELGGSHPWVPLVKRIESVIPSTSQPDLAAAREAFLPFSTNLVALVQLIRSQEEDFRSLKVYQCPMAPKPGLWFQAEGPLRNPYYGAEMLRCGKEVRLLATTTEEPPKILAHLPTSVPAESSTTPVAPDQLADAARFTPTPPSAPTIAARPRRGSAPLSSAAQVQPLNSRDHSAFHDRMKRSLEARFASGMPFGTNAVRGSAVPASSHGDAAEIDPHQPSTN